MNWKKNCIILLLILGIGLMTACSETNNEKEGGNIKIGILQFMEHPALNDAREGFIDALEELNINAEIIYQNANGDIPTTVNISNKFVKDNVDLIYAIGTPAAQSAKQSTDTIPILFSAVTDPVEAGLVKSWDISGSNITGTSDMADVQSQLEMFHQIDSNILDIGIIYNTSEKNSQSQLDMVNSIAPELGLNIISVGVTNAGELNQGLNSLVNKIDAMYILSDNLTAASVDLVSNILIENNIPSISAEESQVVGGILITKGHSYYDLGVQTGNLVKDILLDKKDISNMPVYMPKNLNLKLNKNTLKKLNIKSDIEIFNMAEDINN